MIFSPVIPSGEAREVGTIKGDNPTFLPLSLMWIQWQDIIAEVYVMEAL